MERDTVAMIEIRSFAISTHTLTWSVTVFLKDILAKISNFNSHAHVERDDEITAKRYTKEHFNSHAHVERDWTVVRSRLSMMISTHTLTWSVTWCEEYFGGLMAFQLTRSRGA